MLLRNAGVHKSGKDYARRTRLLHDGRASGFDWKAHYSETGTARETSAPVCTCIYDQVTYQYDRCGDFIVRCFCLLGVFCLVLFRNHSGSWCWLLSLRLIHHPLRSHPLQLLCWHWHLFLWHPPRDHLIYNGVLPSNGTIVLEK